MDVETIHLVPKETIPSFTFSSNDVLHDTAAQEERRLNLLQGMIIGNTWHTKVKLIFECTEGIMQTETTIWATTDDYILLKGGVSLPIRSIHDVIIM